MIDDLDPFRTSIFACLNCDTIFTQPKISYWDGDAEELCPMPGCESTSMDFDEMPEEEIWLTFYDIIGFSFDETRRMNLRMIADAAGMRPRNPLDRLL
jgi:hypothetical protein